MTDAPLGGLRVLVVEDEFLLADELRGDLEEMGAQVIGPVGHLDRALALVRAETAIDAAVLDLNIAGSEVFPLADMLAERGVPMVFATGYASLTLPERFAGVPTCDKPVAQARLLDLLRQLTGVSAQ